MMGALESRAPVGGATQSSKRQEQVGDCLVLRNIGKEGHALAIKIDPQTGAILRTIESNRFVTGVTWIDGELWHGTSEGDESDLRRLDPRTEEVLEWLEM